MRSNARAAQVIFLVLSSECCNMALGSEVSENSVENGACDLKNGDIKTTNGQVDSIIKKGKNFLCSYTGYDILQVNRCYITRFGCVC